MGQFRTHALQKRSEDLGLKARHAAPVPIGCRSRREGWLMGASRRSVCGDRSCSRSSKKRSGGPSAYYGAAGGFAGPGGVANDPTPPWWAPAHRRCHARCTGPTGRRRSRVFFFIQTPSTPAGKRGSGERKLPIEFRRASLTERRPASVEPTAAVRQHWSPLNFFTHDGPVISAKLG
jgi:hypothetical protein